MNNPPVEIAYAVWRQVAEQQLRNGEKIDEVVPRLVRQSSVDPPGAGPEPTDHDRWIEQRLLDGHALGIADAERLLARLRASAPSAGYPERESDIAWMRGTMYARSCGYVPKEHCDVVGRSDLDCCAQCRDRRVSERIARYLSSPPAEAPGEQVEGWVARNKTGLELETVYFFEHEPKRVGTEYVVWTQFAGRFRDLPGSWFPSVLPGTKVRAVLRLAEKEGA